MFRRVRRRWRELRGWCLTGRTEQRVVWSTGTHSLNRMEAEYVHKKTGETRWMDYITSLGEYREELIDHRAELVLTLNEGGEEEEAEEV